MSATQTYKDMVSEIDAFQTKLASAKKGEDVKDPAEKGTAAVPRDPEGTTAAQNMPGNTANATPPATLEVSALKAAPTGENVPSTTPGNPKENVSSPTESLAKISKDITGIVADIRVLQKGAGVETPAAALAAAPVSATPTAATPAKAATAADANALDNMENLYLKLAHTILSTEGGAATVEKILTKAAGEQYAKDLIAQSLQAHDAFGQAQAQYEQQVKAAAAEEQQGLLLADQIFKSAAAKDQEQIIKFANVHDAALRSISDPWLKMAYAGGAGDAADTLDSQEAQAAPGGDPNAQPEIPGGGQGPVGIEQIAELLKAMIASGELKPEEAEQILQELMQDTGGGAGAPQGGEAEAQGAAEANPGEGAPGADEAKSASVLCYKLIR